MDGLESMMQAGRGGGEFEGDFEEMINRLTDRAKIYS